MNDIDRFLDLINRYETPSTPSKNIGVILADHYESGTQRETVVTSFSENMITIVKSLMKQEFVKEREGLEKELETL